MRNIADSEHKQTQNVLTKFSKRIKRNQAMIGWRCSQLLDHSPRKPISIFQLPLPLSVQCPEVQEQSTSCTSLLSSLKMS